MHSQLTEQPAFTACQEKEYAFTSLGIDYYCYTHQGKNMPYTKWFEASLTAEFHDKFTLTTDDFEVYLQSVQDLTTSEQFTEQERLEYIGKLTRNITERRHWQDPLILFKEASVFFFDCSEDPAVYDKAYARVKMKRWLTDPDLVNQGGFFTQPVGRWIPLAGPTVPFSSEALDELTGRMIRHLQMGAEFGWVLTEFARILSQINHPDQTPDPNIAQLLYLRRQLQAFTKTLTPGALLAGATHLN